MQSLKLKYGCNPNQIDARVFATSGDLPIDVLNGNAGYINLLDALNGWQLVKELKDLTGLPSAASFKHVSPAGAAVGLDLSETLKKAYFIDKNTELSSLACAYARARGADRLSSFGDFAAMSDVVDIQTANLLAREVSDGVIAPDYVPEALEILKGKSGGKYCVIKIDSNYSPAGIESKTVFGITFEQSRNDIKIDENLLKNIVSKNKNLPADAARDLLISLIILKYTQSNSVCYVTDGQAIGIGAGQQSRIHCTRLAGDKAERWFLRQHPEVLGFKFKKSIKRPERDTFLDRYILGETSDWEPYLEKKPLLLTKKEKEEWILKMPGVSLGSDAFIPFGDNVERAVKSGVRFIAETGGSLRDDNVIELCDKHGVVLVFTGLRLFHH